MDKLTLQKISSENSKLVMTEDNQQLLVVITCEPNAILIRLTAFRQHIYTRCYVKHTHINE